MAVINQEKLIAYLEAPTRLMEVCLLTQPTFYGYQHIAYFDGGEILPYEMVIQYALIYGDSVEVYRLMVFSGTTPKFQLGYVVGDLKPLYERAAEYLKGKNPKYPARE